MDEQIKLLSIACQALSEAVLAACKRIVAFANAVITGVYGMTGNRRVIHLAQYARKRRTRKKNQHRIAKEMCLKAKRTAKCRNTNAVR